MQKLKDKLKAARDLAWKSHGKKITFYVPGMVHHADMVGKYQAVSITGGDCALNCDHCQGQILQSMHWATTPSDLVEKCIRFDEKGNHGVLISGGCDKNARLPWKPFIKAIKEIKANSKLAISVHSGLVDEETARGLKSAGVDQALIDVIGDDKIFQNLYHLPFGISQIIKSLNALNSAGLEIVPHVVCGLRPGSIRSEKKAIEIISNYKIRQIVIVSVMKLSRSQGRNLLLPRAESIAEIISEARMAIPEASISLGCARERGNRAIELLAIEAGVDRLALPSDEAIEKAHSYGLETRFQPTCCSVAPARQKHLKGTIHARA